MAHCAEVMGCVSGVPRKDGGLLEGRCLNVKDGPSRKEGEGCDQRVAQDANYA